MSAAGRMRGGALARILLGLVLFAVIAAAGIVWHDYARFTTAPLAVRGTDQSIDIARGSSFKHIVGQLRGRHLSAAPAWYWRILALRMGVAKSLHAGEYALPEGITPRRLLDNMAQGKVLRHQFTLIDGWTFKQVRTALNAAGKLAHDSADMDDAAIMKRIGATDEDPEGRFLPETYAYVKGDTDLDLLKRAHQAMQKVLADEWAARDPEVPLKSPYQALILASLVEKETARSDERSRIAGVFARRLKMGMPLQTDPTVIYGMGEDYHGDITWKALRTDTPWNTYLHKGLPPTPIAMPGKVAIHAALHPAAGKALYFVARGDGSGRHVFSDTLGEHNRAVACHQLKRCR